MAYSFINSLFFIQRSLHFKLGRKKIFKISKRLYSPIHHVSYNPEELTEFTFPNQIVYAGMNSLQPVVEVLKNRSVKKPLIVSDPGLSKAGVVHVIQSELESQGLSPEVFDGTQSDPSCKDVINIAEAYNDNQCDSCIGLGGGGPLDACKIGMALVAQKKVDPSFDIVSQGTAFVSEKLRHLLKDIPTDFAQSVPFIAAIPTTAGTGSEGGKSAVITLPYGKVVIGHPIFLPQIVALIPQLTENLPPGLTSATAIDALFHCIEAFLVPFDAGIKDGLSPDEIEVCETFAKKGTLLVLNNLMKVMDRPSDLTARLNLQIGALCGAKAFRKGDLGAIHATAHAIGRKYHIHHGTAIARMSVPVIAYNETKLSDEQSQMKFQLLVSLFNESGIKGTSLSEVVREFLKPLGLPYELEGLSVSLEDVADLASLAASDGCQTNVIPLSLDDYFNIFQSLVSGSK